MQLLKKLLGTAWGCVFNVYWFSLFLFNLPLVMLDVFIRSLSMSAEDKEELSLKYKQVIENF